MKSSSYRAEGCDVVEREMKWKDWLYSSCDHLQALPSSVLGCGTLAYLSWKRGSATEKFAESQRRKTCEKKHTVKSKQI